MKIGGGEEFAGILPGVCCDEAKAIAERLREKVANKDLSEFNIEQKLTVSIGVACLDQVDTSFDDLLKKCQCVGRLPLCPGWSLALWTLLDWKLASSTHSKMQVLLAINILDQCNVLS